MLLFRPEEIIQFYYPSDTPLRERLFYHSNQVAQKAMELAKHPNTPILPEEDWILAGALLHDIGIGHCYAPSIDCTGSEDYMRHGLIGGELLRQYGKQHNLDLEVFARICERHTGSGLTKEDIQSQQLPLPLQDFLPETPLEKLICLADKFFSKSSSMEEKPFWQVRRSMEKFGPAPLARFDRLCQEFDIKTDSH